MKKERRDFSDCKKLDFTSNKYAFEEHIAIKTGSLKDKGVVYKEYQILPKFGVGSIIKIEMESIDITINKFKLEEDFYIYKKDKEDFIQLSFLLEGAKIISLEDVEEDIFYENQESYFVSINSFSGYTRILRGKLFKEIKIKLSNPFLLMHGFTNDIILKKISDKNIIIPITDELFTILSDLENKNLKGITQELFLKAKVFELLAIQIESYKNFNGNNKQVGKTIKKLYTIKQLIKNNPHKSYSTRQLSIEMTINEHILKKEFKRVFGYSISKFSTIEKMNTAKNLLKNPQLAIYQVAEKIGYKNATHFTVAFKRCFGETPKCFRNNLL